MSTRSYLSIGDVLTLLREEFPDVTISKIRFLESQGLVNPERTPSGYRKFYEHDVERLRWVLRQQREHFLPLKVIRGRLDQVPGGEAGRAETVEESRRAPESEPVLAGRGLATPASAGPASAGPASPAPGAATHASAVTGAATHATGTASGVLASGVGATLPGFEPSGAAGPVPPVVAAAAAAGAGAAEADVARAASAGPTGQVAGGRPPVPGPPMGGRMATSEVGRTREAAGGRPARPVVPSAGPGRPDRPVTEHDLEARRDRDHRDRDSRRRETSGTTSAEPAGIPAGESVAAGLDGAVTGASLTAEELAAAAGLTPADIAQLESFGLVSGRAVAGTVYYDEEALGVARIAAGFARFGVEPRHLRVHKHAAEREAGLIEQVVLPLLKQRNPEARRRALDAVDELSKLGQGLRSAMLRAALRDQIGG